MTWVYLLFLKPSDLPSEAILNVSKQHVCPKSPYCHGILFLMTY